MTAEKASLGKKLYFDKRLSTDRTVSCGACHDLATALADAVSSVTARPLRRSRACDATSA